MASESTSPKLSGMQFQIVRPLGNGAGSTILLIRDKAAGGKRYALKVVKRQSPDDDVYIAQAQLEFAVSQRLNHPTIIKIYDIRLKRSLFRVAGVELLEEFVDGKTLDEIEAPEMGQLVLIFRKVCSGLNHMHRRGVYHGDLKPSNIMLSRAGEVKLIDFGTAWIRGQEKNRVQGTPQYMAPEQPIERVVDQRTDHLQLRRHDVPHVHRPLRPAGDFEAGRGARGALVPPIEINPKIPGTLNETIMACLELAPERRPAGAFAIKHQLNAVAKSLGLSKGDLKGAEDEE